ncbi:MAG: type II toxin-antitoxin system YafQ family toxin [Synergistaceae bacterium]|nr:type II toxin-antitoxin system YafQ family toxin [Synergistaceae bacterium]
MTAQKSSGLRRTPFPREIHYYADFKRDWEKLERSGKHDMHRIKEAISLLMMNEGPLTADWRDHKLSGDWEGFRELHVKGDLLVVYQMSKKSRFEVVVFYRIGTHSELF